MEWVVWNGVSVAGNRGSIRVGEWQGIGVAWNGVG
jgi:hypothetical protein